MYSKSYRLSDHHTIFTLVLTNGEGARVPQFGVLSLSDVMHSTLQKQNMEAQE